MGALNHCRGAELLLKAPKSPNNVTSTFFNTINLPSKKLRFDHRGAKLRPLGRRFPRGRRICFLPRAPSNLVTPCIYLLLSAGLTVGFRQPHAKQASPVWWRYSHLIPGAWLTTVQRRNEVRRRPGQEASLMPPCSNLKSLGSKCTVLKKVLVTLFELFGAPAVIRSSP